MSEDFVKPPFGPAIASRGLRVVRQIEEKLDSGGYGPKDISSARWRYDIRAYAAPDDTDFVVEETVDASATEATDGWLDSYVDIGTAPHESMIWELVEIDMNNNAPGTRSTKREVVIVRWRQAIEDAPP